MSAARKYKHYVPESPTQDAKENHEQKKIIHNLKAKIENELSKDVELQKRAASIIEKMINQK